MGRPVLLTVALVLVAVWMMVKAIMALLGEADGLGPVSQYVLAACFLFHLVFHADRKDSR